MKRIDRRFVSPLLIAAGLAMLLFGAALGALAAQSTNPQDSGQQDVHDTPVPLPAPEQPIPYSHKPHLALGLECTMCHTNPGGGRMMTFPPTATCMSCHNIQAKNKPSIQKLAAYDASKKTVPWVRVYTVLPGVNWSHRRHLDAGMKCETCHGEVRQMLVMTNVKSVTTMVGCIDCHTLHKAKTTCVTCHPAWAPEMVVAK
ncbi:MAG: cytochrome c family protein [Acidobacteriia bacterium]|nr:cytochrome c family protein [Terriglobia bacterium]